MFSAYLKAFGQLSDPRIRSVIWKSVLATLAIYAVLITAVSWGLTATSVFDIGWLETAGDVFGGLAAVIIALILFPGVVSGFVSVLLEDVADAVEAKHYPGLEPPLAMGWGTLATTSGRLILLTIVLNILALPLYFIPVVNIVVYYLLNGALLGREYFEVAALRRMRAKEAAALRRRHRTGVIAMGGATAFLLTIPIVNMIAPVLGAAAMVHFFHRLRGA